MIPIKYNVRNLRVRWATTTLAVLATGLVVWSSCVLFGFIDGLEHSLDVSGDPLDLIVLRNGSTTDVNSGFEASKADELANLDGVARDPDGGLLAAQEVVTIPVVPRRDGSRANVALRGVVPASRALRPDFTIVRGRDLEPGKGECIVSMNISRRFAGAGLGEEFRISPKEAYRVVGLFTAGGSSAESEIWADIGDLRRSTGAEGSVSCVQLRAASAADRDRLRDVIRDDERFRLSAIDEVTYFESQTESATFLKAAGILIALLLSVGAMFASANTMFSAVKSRSREIGTMRALGFRGRDILASFLSESLLLCLMGGVVGLLATLPLSRLTFGTSNFSTFSELTINFRFGPWVLGGALLMTLAMGLFGGLFPAVRAVRMNVIDSLREV